MALFAAGIVLLLNIWGGKRSGVATDPAREMEDVHKAMKMLKSMERRYVCELVDMAGYSLASCAGGIPQEGSGERTVSEVIRVDSSGCSQGYHVRAGKYGRPSITAA